jgi:D-tyrosyl-tRNA(Tyr) deacylase
MRTENLFSAILTFGMLAAGAVGFGGELLAPRQAVATLPTVTVIGHRVAEVDRVTMPTVVVTGRRIAPTEVAIATETVQQRVQ